MAGADNLKVPTSEEARKYGRKGGIASGKARREKADLKKKVNQILEMDVFSPQLKERLERDESDSNCDGAFAKSIKRRYASDRASSQDERQRGHERRP